MRLERLILDRFVTPENRVLVVEFQRRALLIRLAQKRQQVVDSLHIGLLPEAQEFPEALRRRDASISAGRVEDVVEPALRLGKPPILAQVNRDRKRDVKEELPVVIGIRAAVAKVDLFRG